MPGDSKAPLDSPTMFRRRRVSQTRPDVLQASLAFRVSVDGVEEAKGRLAAAAPGGRSRGVPLAEALAAFEVGLHETQATMAAWRIPDVEDVWNECSAALAESLRRAERLRLGDAPDGYEQLYGTLGDLMDPLEAFASAVDRFRALSA
jgi:hypothetical protein